MSLTYEIVSGDLPIGTRLDPKGLIMGSIYFENLLNAPTWVTPEGELADVTVGDEIESIVLEATPKDEDEFIVSYSLVDEYQTNKGLPWGLRLDAATGEIYGTIFPLRKPGAISWKLEELPIWETEGGLLATFDELEAVSLSLEASPVDELGSLKFTVVEGYLPWGLTLDVDTGEIVGTVNRLRETSGIPEMTPKPTWNTPRGNLALFDELDEVFITINATPNLGDSLKYMIISGGLPWGLSLDPTTGVISGTIDHLKTVEPLVELTPKPSWITATNLGTFGLEETVDTGVLASPQLGDEIVTYSIVKGYLPWGLVLDAETGEIAGTIDPTTKVGSYTFIVKAEDSLGAYSFKTFNLNVIEPVEEQW